MSQQLPIVSTLHSNLRIRPVTLWLFFNMVGALACGGAAEEGYFLITFSTYFIICTGIVLAWTFSIIRQKEMLIIDQGQLRFTDYSGKTTRTYILEELIDFSWSNAPFSVRANYYSDGVALKHEGIRLDFKDQEPVVIYFDEYGNFEEIKKYLFSYAVKQGIINIQPLEKRKRR